MEPKLLTEGVISLILLACGKKSFQVRHSVLQSAATHVRQEHCEPRSGQAQHDPDPQGAPASGQHQH